MESCSIYKYNKFLIPAIFIFALILRLYNIDYSFSNDELSAVMRTGYNSISDVVINGVLIDFHPAGIQVFLNYWINIFGNSEFAVRFPFAIFGSIASVFVFINTRKIFGLTPALLSAVAISVLEFSLLHGQLARPYSSGLMLASLQFYFWYKIIFQKPLNKIQLYYNATLLAIVFAASAYNHYFSALTSVLLAISGLFYIKRTRFIAYAYSGILSTILFIPHINTTLYHLSKGSIGSWLSAPNNDFIWTHILHNFNDSNFLLTIIISLIIAFILLRQNYLDRIINKFRILVLSLFIAPIIIAFVYSVSIGPILQDRILLFNTPYLLMFMFSFVRKPITIPQKSIVLGIGVLMLFHTVFINKYYSTQHFIDFRGIAEKVNTSEMETEDLLRIQNTNNQKYLQYYLDDTISKYEIYELINEDDIANLRHILANNRKIECEFVSLRPINNLAKLMISSSFPFLIDTYADNWQNGYYLYSRLPSINPIADSLITLVENNYSLNIIDLSKEEFSKGLSYKSDKNRDIYIEINIEFIDNFEDNLDQNKAVLVITKTLENGESDWMGFSLKDFIKPLSKNAIIGNIPYFLEENSELKIYVWNPEKQDIKLINCKFAIKK